MKKFLLTIATLAVLAGQIFAAPVDVNTAKNLGIKYLRANVLAARGINDVQLAYTLSSADNVPYLYVFNYENGFVIMSADDRAFPVLGYGDTNIFDENNLPDGLRYYLGHYGRQIQYAIDNELVADAAIAEQWDLLRKEGVVVKSRDDKAVNPLITTIWDQDWPYNTYAPQSTYAWAPGGHCYAGCVATAMSQVMKFWNWPETGNGSHTYTTLTSGETLSVNFGATTYDWANMPQRIYSSSPTQQIQAIALLMYHCGVSVDMDYKGQASGAYSVDVPPAVVNYFRYGTCTNLKYRDDYSLTDWQDLLIDNFDRGFPMLYAGHDTDGGHAFNCDGYNNQRMFHFNFGWSGMYNNYYQIDAINTGNGSFNTGQCAVFDMVPDYICDKFVPAIETMTAEPVDAVTKTVTVSWVVPTQSVTGVPLESVQQITLKRNGTVIQTFDNSQPGEKMTFEDTVDEYGAYIYSIIGKNNYDTGMEFSYVAIVGPCCTWKLTGQTTNFQGWNGGKVQFVSPNGVIFAEATMESSTPISKKMRFPEGNITLNWVAPTSTVSSLTMQLKNSANQSVYSYTGSSAQLGSTLYTGVNDCPNCTAPTDFTGEFVYVNDTWGAILSWNCDYQPSKFKIFRSEDGTDYVEIANVNGDVHEYFDEVENGTYYYKVTAYSTACESNPALTPDNVDYVVVIVSSVTENSINARIYPNPTTGNLKIEADRISNIEVFNLVGQKVYEANVNDNECVINMNEFGVGIYMVRIHAESGLTTQKVSVIE